MTIGLAVKEQVPPVADAITAPLARPTSGQLTTSIVLYPDPLLGAVLAATFARAVLRALQDEN